MSQINIHTIRYTCPEAKRTHSWQTRGLRFTPFLRVTPTMSVADPALYLGEAPPDDATITSYLQ